MLKLKINKNGIKIKKKCILIFIINCFLKFEALFRFLIFNYGYKKALKVLLFIKVTKINAFFMHF